MKSAVAFMCIVLLAISQADRRSQFNKEEEECLFKTGVSREVVLQDKGLKFPGQPKVVDPKFTDYLECYRDKLDQLGKLTYTKSTHVKIPGYKTQAVLPGVYCTEEELSGKVPLLRQCAYPPSKLK
ncbi:hypothetical protein ILUMI_18779 [Ignelater luminosus]|uniref:Uncharacterized protein n=1 Tax=Ignelater luminosus TaxID=2038154 RepID=A0A8K0CHC7_IGNLU|nr:hypothetical protein ILUMI_18779 [Ignelater luminosus]